MSADYLLHETSVGYAIYKVALQGDAVGVRMKEVQDKMESLTNFGKMVDLVSFAPFHGAAHALENANDISEGIASDYLKSVIEANIAKAGKKKVVLGVTDKNLAASLKAEFPYLDCETPETNEVVADLLRGLRLHANKLMKQLQDGDISRAQLGLGHAYSRAKVKFNVQRNDNHIIQSIAILDHLEKAVNTFSMRVREWYSWHFPELVRLVSDSPTFAKAALFVGDKKSLSEEKIPELAAIVNNDEAVAQNIVNAARVSMGRDMSESDMEHVMDFARRAVSLAECRKSLQAYLSGKMNVVAPNVAALIGDAVGARLISKAGSLTNLSKCAASTVQILGAEKALFRALKTKGKTPKYGLIYNSSFIAKAGPKNKGRISRFLANKTSVAARIDNFSEAPTSTYGEFLRRQVEERIEFYHTGKAPSKNADVMKAAMDKVLSEMPEQQGPSADSDVEMDDKPAEEEKSKKKEKGKKEEKSKKEKKDKKEKRKSLGDDGEKRSKKSKK